MNQPEEKLKALLEGMEAQNIDELLETFSIEDYRLFGEAITEIAREMSFKIIKNKN